MKRRFVLGGILLVLVCHPGLAQEGKRPIPSETEQQQALAVAREVYGEEYKAAKTGEQKRALAEKLMQKAADSKSDPVSNFVLLKLARDVAAAGGEADLALKAVEEIATSFDVKPVTMKQETFTKAAYAARTPRQSDILARAALALIEESFAADDFEIAQEVGRKGLVAAKAARQKELVSLITIKIKEAAGNAAELGKVKEAMAALQDRPTDPALNLEVGKYLCFVKGDWDNGLPMLALGSDEKLKGLATQELKGVTDPNEQAKLGDSWWERSEEESGAAKKRLSERATYWYRKSLVSLSGLARDRVQKRLDSAPQAEEQGNQQIRQSIEAGLNWLAQKQSGDGSWTFATQPDPGTHGSLAAATSLAVTPFIRAGSTHISGKYQPTVSKAITFLLGRMKNQGDLRDGGDGDTMYVQGIATIALCEVYALSKDKKLRGPCQSAVNFIVSVQHPKTGGWRYKPGNEGDTSVVGWQVTALKIADSTGLPVPRQTFAGVHHWLDKVQEDNGAFYSYIPRSGRSPSMTASGLLCRVSLGWDPRNDAVRKGVKYLSELGPPSPSQIYYVYHATRLFHLLGGEAWQRWRKSLVESLTRVQHPEGSNAGSFLAREDKITEQVGRLGYTTFCLMSLEVGQ